MSKGRKYNWAGVDWSKSNRQIANELKTTPSYVQRWRELKSPKTALRHRKRVGNINWQGVDWTQSNEQIARELGTRRDYVVQWRRTLAPETSAQRRDWTKVDWSKTDQQIARESGYNPIYVAQQRRVWTGRRTRGTKRRRQSIAVTIKIPRDILAECLNAELDLDTVAADAFESALRKKNNKRKEQ